MKLSEYFDAYSIKARVVPGVISAAILMLLLFNMNLLNSSDSFGFIDYLGVGIGTFALTTFLGFIVQSVGKHVVEKNMFSGKNKMPSTTLLLEKNHKLPKTIKKKIVETILARQGVNLHDIYRQYENDENQLCTEICSCITELRDSTRDNLLLKNELIQYGFWRNLSGGIIIVFFSFLFISLATHAEVDELYLPTIGLVIFFVFCLYLTKESAHSYAVKLFEVYVGKE